MTLTPAELISTGDRPSAGAAPSRAIVRALVTQELRTLARRGESLLVMFGIPLAVLLFGGVGIAGSAPGTRSLEALLPGTLALALMATGLVSLGITTAYDRVYGVLKRLGGSPATGWQVVIAKVLAIGAVELLQAAALVVTAVLVLGWVPAGLDLVLAVIALALGSATFAGLGLLLASTLRAEATLAVTNGLFLGSLLLGGIVVPLERLPGPLADLARLLPATALADVLRHALGMGEPIATALPVLLAWAVAATLAAVTRFRWD